jgi:hypothetical protein
MTRDDASSIVNQAIDQLIEHDSELLDLGVTERSLAHQLATYMSLSNLVQPPLKVDCEYNRHLSNIKRLNLPQREAADRDLCATIVFPDIVVHKRNSDEQNFIVLELKKLGEDIAYDEQKLNAFRQQLGYKHAAHVILGIDKENQVIRHVLWVDA